MQNQIIGLSDALKIIHSRSNDGSFLPFDFTYRTFNSQTKQGGKLKSYKSCKLLPAANPDSKPSLNPIAIFSKEKASKNPNHFENRTRNIELIDGSVKSIRIDFIISVNNIYINY